MGLPSSFHVAVATLCWFMWGSETPTRLRAMQHVQVDVEDNDTGVGGRLCDTLPRLSGNGSVRQ
eukprot:731592-Pyramimonas_sp.AAC.1